MRFCRESIRVALIVTLSLAGARFAGAQGQAAGTAVPQVPGIIVTPQGPSGSVAPHQTPQDALEGGATTHPNAEQPVRSHPHGGCRYDDQPLELIV